MSTAESGVVTAGPVDDGVVKPATTELTKVSGVSEQVWAGGSTFLPSLKQDMELSVRKSTIRDVLKQSTVVKDKLNLVLGEFLYEVTKNRYWSEWKFVDDKGEDRPYADYKEYLNSELGLELRTAQYFTQIYEKFVVELKLPVELLSELEWSKAKEIVKVITEDNAIELIGKIRTLSRVQVIDMANMLKGGGGSGPTHEPTVNRSFKFTEEQVTIIDAALKMAASMGVSDKPNAQLEMICAEFISSTITPGTDGALIKLDTMIKAIERNFHVKVNVEAIDAEHFAGATT